jgi:glycosyltransferase involved in cell wall biosynthesis
VFNSARSLEELVRRIDSTLAKLDWRHEVILVNDASKDASWDRIETLAASVPCVKGIDLMRNYGQHNALLAGIREVRYPVVVTMDDDLQHPPEEIPRLIRELESGYDVVYGAPEQERQARWRGLASRLTKLALQKAMGAETATKINSFRAFRTSLREGFAAYQGPYVSIDALLTWSTLNFGETPYRHDERKSGSSAYSTMALVRHALTLMTAFSTRPLQLASIVGFGSVVFGVIVLAYVMFDYVVSSSDVPGFPFLASLVSILAGAQLFAIGVIGEYLARVHVRTMEKPAYTVRNRTPVPQAEDRPPPPTRPGEEVTPAPSRRD